MEVKVEELYLVLVLALIDLSDILGCDSDFSLGRVSQKIDDIDRAVVLNDLAEMNGKGLLGHLCIPSQLHILSETSLFPENWHRGTELNMTYQVGAIDNHDLFFLAGVGYPALVVNASSVVPRASSVVVSSGDQSDLYWCIANLALSLGEVALNEGSEPSAVDLLVDEILVQVFIPKVSMVTSYQSERIIDLFLHPLNSSLSRASHVIAVREIKSIVKVSLHIFNHLVVARLWIGSKWEHLHICNLKDLRVVERPDLLGILDGAQVVLPTDVHDSHDSQNGAMLDSLSGLELLIVID